MFSLHSDMQILCLELTGFSSNSETSVSGMRYQGKLIVSCLESRKKKTHMVKGRCGPNSQSMFLPE